ncbi:ADP-ribosylglycohydrolase [Nocardia amikacinitolerans]|nr:ADP-ribosylglycohydrolase family protein [Nocardia amikacinitolerans]MCP2274630.1 ADP-ribosylglycohydrolase [Nocardia amikacinitolerans]
MRDGITSARGLLDVGQAEAARALGNGRDVSAPDTVPYCLWIAARFDDFAEACWATASAGGDVDTTCAIVGGILGARDAAIPDEWVRRCEELPEWSGITLTGSAR